MNRTGTKRLVLGGLMVALSTALSFVKFFDLPYGGSVTLCSMLPLALFAFLCGRRWGLAAGFTHGALQLLFGLGALKGVSAATVVGSILLDYLLAFSAMGLAGTFRGRVRNDPAAFAAGIVLSGLIRYAMSFVSGCILWGQFASAGAYPVLSGMKGTGLIICYSLVYNGAYMIPEIIVTAVAGTVLMAAAGKALIRAVDEK